MAKPINEAIKETKEHLQLNWDEDATDEGALDALDEDCGQMPDGSCQFAGTEYCDWECPFSG